MQKLRGLSLSLALLSALTAKSAQAQLVAAPVDSASAHRTPTQRDVARMLFSSDTVKRVDGLRMAQMVRPQYASSDLRFGLVFALSREAADYQSRLRASRLAGSGAVKVGRPVSKVHDQLLTAVVALNDSISIPALANSLGTGMTPIRALVGFGQGATVSTLRVTNASTSEHEQVADGLLTLRLMVDNATHKPLTAAIRTRIHDAATSRLSGTQSLDVLLRAIDLAIALGDGELRQTVAVLAANRDEVQRRGIQSASQIDQVQARAHDRLAGIPAQPRS